MARMDVVETAMPARIDRPMMAAIFAGTCNLLILILLSYQIYLEQPPSRPIVMSYPLSISGLYYLTPVLVVIVFRHVAVVTFTYAFILFLILAGRTYYLVQYYLVGIRGLKRPFDEPDEILFVLSAVSITLIFLWIIVRLAGFAINALNRKRGVGDGW
jgi:hypothetical protein